MTAGQNFFLISFLENKKGIKQIFFISDLICSSIIKILKNLFFKEYFFYFKFFAPWIVLKIVTLGVFEPK